MRRKRDPKVGTGKKPKGSGRRLYTDENPKDTVSIKFATPADARETVAKVKRVNKSFARKRSKAQGVGGKPTNVPTFAKRKKAMMGGFMGRRMGIR